MSTFLRNIEETFRKQTESYDQMLEILQLPEKTRNLFHSALQASDETTEEFEQRLGLLSKNAYPFDDPQTLYCRVEEQFLKGLSDKKLEQHLTNKGDFYSLKNEIRTFYLMKTEDQEFHCSKHNLISLRNEQSHMIKEQSRQMQTLRDELFEIKKSNEILQENYEMMKDAFFETRKKMVHLRKTNEILQINQQKMIDHLKMQLENEKVINERQENMREKDNQNNPKNLKSSDLDTNLLQHVDHCPTVQSVTCGKSKIKTDRLTTKENTSLSLKKERFEQSFDITTNNCAATEIVNDQTSNTRGSFRDPKRRHRKEKKPYARKAKVKSCRRVHFRIGSERIYKMMFDIPAIEKKNILVDVMELAKTAHQTQTKLKRCKTFTIPLKQRSRLWDRGKVPDPLKITGQTETDTKCLTHCLGQTETYRVLLDPLPLHGSMSRQENNRTNQMDYNAIQTVLCTNLMTTRLSHNEVNRKD